MAMRFFNLCQILPQDCKEWPFFMDCPIQAENADFSLDSYDYFLPPESIAQHPSPKKDDCRLMVLDRSGEGKISDAFFRDLGAYLPPHALLVANNSRVLPARIMAKRSGGGRLEFLLLTPLPLLMAAKGEAGGWSRAEAECLLRPAAKIKIGAAYEIAPELYAEVLEKGSFGKHRVMLAWRGNLEEIFNARGKLPLPPYIRREAESGDAQDYQTVFAKKTGSVAAPTAGLHFSGNLRQELLKGGFDWAEITLYVGYGTFSPVRCQDIRSHAMHSEYIEISQDTAAAIREAKKAGRPVAAIGTTSLRAMEGMAENIMAGRECSGFTDIFLYPGKKITMPDALITNFHLPRSTLLMLVSAFAGREKILRAYAQAVENGYRFFSYGDAMLIR